MNKFKSLSQNCKSLILKINSKFIIMSVLFLLIMVLFVVFKYENINVKINGIGSIHAIKDSKESNEYNYLSHQSQLKDNQVIVTIRDRFDENIIEMNSTYYVEDKIIGVTKINKNTPINVLRIQFPEERHYNLYSVRIIKRNSNYNSLTYNDTIRKEDRILAINGIEYVINSQYDLKVSDFKINIFEHMFKDLFY